MLPLLSIRAQSPIPTWPIIATHLGNFQTKTTSRWFNLFLQQLLQHLERMFWCWTPWFHADCAKQHLSNKAQSPIPMWSIQTTLGQFALIICFWQHLLVLLHKNPMASRQLQAKWTKQCPVQSQQCSIQLSERAPSHLALHVHSFCWQNNHNMGAPPQFGASSTRSYTARPPPTKSPRGGAQFWRAEKPPLLLVPRLTDPVPWWY